MSVSSIGTMSSTSSASVMSAPDIITNATTQKIIELIECYVCMKKTQADAMHELVHKSNIACALHLNKKICMFCLTDLNQTCPSCYETTSTGARPLPQTQPNPKAISFWQSARELQEMELSDDAISRLEDRQVAQRATKYIHISRQHGCLIGGKGYVVICCCFIFSCFLGVGTYVIYKATT